MGAPRKVEAVQLVGVAVRVLHHQAHPARAVQGEEEAHLLPHEVGGPPPPVGLKAQDRPAEVHPVGHGKALRVKGQGAGGKEGRKGQKENPHTAHLFP